MKVKCGTCGTWFVAQRKTAKYCSSTCRVQASRSPAKKTKAKPRRRGPTFESATRDELKRLGKLSTMLGQQAIVLARRMSDETETGSAIAALSREHSRIMEALGATVPPQDEVGSARDRREAKLRAAGLL